MTAIRLLTTGRGQGHWQEMVYQGDILIFKHIPPLLELCALTDTLIRTAFDALDPVRAQFALGPEEYVARVEALQKQYRKHPEARQLLMATLEHVGADLQHTGWDWLHLRVMPDGDSHASRRTQQLGFHRDTWSSNVYAQLNWWLPIYPLTPERALAFYPTYWSRPLANTSATWDLEEIRARGGNAPVVPTPSEPVDTTGAVVLVPEPGDLLCFSGAHLHASVPNTSGVARFSVEVRTVDIGDAVQHRGAANVDGHAPHIALEWFHRITDGCPVPQVMAATGQDG